MYATFSYYRDYPTLWVNTVQIYRTEPWRIWTKKECLKIPNEQPEAVNERLTANLMANKKKDKKTDNGQQTHYT